MLKILLDVKVENSSIALRPAKNRRRFRVICWYFSSAVYNEYPFGALI